ncbi:hypothetical protein AX16_006364 [Volvariella volvacea WC 439]|nr:hypothetical protein AX16_006364 [Volvariella volvacea WC 439]
MNSLQLAPYDESMRLGQGYNSFLQLPCVYGAVKVNPDNIIVENKLGQDGVPQIVSYSSRIVSKISEVTRFMNISAGASVKNGSITLSGHQSTIDETKFAASDLNAVISVKVINQTTRLDDKAEFVPIQGVTNKTFHSIYGDSYISGFINGGEFHSIVSINVLDSAQKETVITSLKQRLNGAGDKGFVLKSSDFNSTFAPEMKQTETSIFVNWCGGGQIKRDDEQWSLESLFRAAAAFPNKVAACPQRCWAILTRYPNNPKFLHSELGSTTKVHNFAGVQQYAADLLDAYIEYKNNLLIVNKILDDPTAYVLGPGNQPVDVRAEALIEERQNMKSEMAKIVSEIEKLNLDPSSLPTVILSSDIESPEVWATRLPAIRVDHNTGSQNLSLSAPSTSVTDALKLFRFVDQAASQAAEDLIRKVAAKPSGKSGDEGAEESLPKLATAETEVQMSAAEKAFILEPKNRRRYGNKFLFETPCGTPGRPMNFNDCETLGNASVQVTWPTRLEIVMVHWGDNAILGYYRLDYDQLRLSHGSTQNAKMGGQLVMNLGPGDRITRIKLGWGNKVHGVQGITYVEVWATGQHKRVGSSDGSYGSMEKNIPAGFTGLKGFYGSHQDEKVIERIGCIWGK